MSGTDPKALLNKAGSMFGGFTTGQRAMTAIAALAVVVGGFFFVQWVSTPSYAPLFTGLSGSDAAAVTAKLSESGTPYQLADGGQTVLVPQAEVYQQRINLSGQGLPAGDDSSQGYSLLDNQSMTSSDFQQKVTYQRALEGELAKTINAIDGVQSTVVHLAVPQDDVFTADETKPTASVLVKTAPGTSLSTTAVDSIVNLVSGSVPKLKGSDVTVADATGAVLSAGGDSSGAAGGSDARRTQQRAVAETTAASVQSMLDKVLGPGRSVVRVDATLNFDAQTTNREEYVPTDPKTTLSSQKSTEKYEGTGNGGTGGVLGSTNAPTGSSGNGKYEKTDTTETNAVGTVKETTTSAPGKVERLSIAVLLDERAAGVTSSAEVTRLVSAAAGVDTKRGDIVEVSSMAFDQTTAKAAEKELEAAADAQQQDELIDLGKTIGLGVLILLALFVGLRFTRRRPEAESPEVIDYYPVHDGPSPATQVLEMAEARALPSREVPEPFVPAGREAVETLARDNPDDVARLLRGWISEGAK